MLDIRAVAYISPLSEMTFTDVPLTVRISNVADETAIVTGRFRVYNNITGLLLHTSEIVPFSIAAGQTIDASALTDFTPPAPLDDTYFVVFDGNASNALVPDGIGIFLGAFHFDIKPGALGPPPAAHAPTHENAGSDPVHIEALPTTELDAANVLAPDGTGGVHFVPASAATDHGALLGLLDDDHPQYLLRHEIYSKSDLTGNASVNSSPWNLAVILSGTISQLSGSELHPGCIRIASSTSANSGGYCNLASRTSFLLAGGESSRIWFRPQTLSGTTIRLGFHDTNDSSAPADGAHMWMDPATGIIYGRTSSNTVTTTTGTGYQLLANTWYMAKVVVNSNATRVDFYLYDEAGTLLWSDFNTTNIPTVAGRELGHGLVATNSGTTAVNLVDMDSIEFSLPDRRPDL